MKKRLEAELISIAHRILKLKNLSELKQLHLETQKLYETLSVLKFVEENINIIQPKINVDDVEQKLENTFDKPNYISAVENEKIEVKEEITVYKDAMVEEKLVYEDQKIEIIKEEPIIETKINVIEDEVIEKKDEVVEEEKLIIEEKEPIFIPEFEPKKEELKLDKKPEPVQISFDEFKFAEPVFEKKSDIKEDKPLILNEKLSKGINIGLNDKIAFVKHLFSDSNEDYNRVLSQINTFNTYFETVKFINEIVKPDYNNWEDKDEYVLRFLESVEKKFV
jgi:hypothetical protein